MHRPVLYISQILEWSDAFHSKTGRWPKRDDGPIGGSLDLSWRRVDNALRYGLRGLRAGSSLARLLEEHRGVRNIQHLPELTEEQILDWAQQHRRTGHWPNEDSGAVLIASAGEWQAVCPEEQWKNIDMALREGHRGLPGATTLAQLIARRLGKPALLHFPAT